MTALSITVSNSVKAFGGGPPSLWNAYSWNAFKWGEGTAKIPTLVRHLVTVDPFAFASSYNFRFVKYVNAESITPDSTVNKIFAKAIGNSLTPSSEPAHQYLTDQSGYYRVFVGGGTDGATRVDSAWATDSETAGAWTKGTQSFTTWSAA